MSLLRKQNWIVNVILMIISEGLYTFVLAYLLNVYKKDAWYADYRYWIIGALFFIFPLFLLLLIFWVQTTCMVAKKLNVPGDEIYGLPYAWILCIIFPIIGWALLIVMLLYIHIWILVMLAKGEGEQYVEY